jgi:outer membrane receptor for ferrienterochelin and colicins
MNAIDEHSCGAPFAWKRAARVFVGVFAGVIFSLCVGAAQERDKQGASSARAATEFASIEGVLTAASGEPTGFATVRIVEAPSLGARADSAGKFRIARIPAPGAYTLEVRRLGLQTLRAPIRVQAGETLRLRLTLKPEQRSTEQLVVTGSWRETLISESPIMVESYTPAFLKKNPSACLFDALQIANGVRPQMNCNVCGTGDIRINGLPGAYTMIAIDGMPIVSGLGTVYGLSGIPPALIERIEIVKGPASMLYGSEAVAGMINVVTKSPARASAFSVDAFSTSWLEHNLDLGAKFIFSAPDSGAKPFATALFGVNAFHYANRIDNNGDNFMDAPLQDRVSAFTKWIFHREDKGEASLAARYVYENRTGGEMAWRPEFRGGDSVYGESIFTNRVEVLGAYQLPIPNERVILRGSFNHHHQNSYYGYIFYEATQQIAFAQLTWEKKLWDAHEILFGVAARYNFYQDNTPATNDAQGRATPEHIVLPGVFAQDEIALSPAHTLLVGARLDYSSAHGFIFTPRLNYKWNVSDDDILRFSAGTGFRVVNLFTEDHAALTGAREVVIREALRPEESFNANLHYAKTLRAGGALWTLDASAFYTYFTNKIIPDYDADPNKIIYDNLRGYAVSQGASLNVSVAFDDAPLSASVGATAMDVFDVEDGTRAWQVFSERWSATFAVSYALTDWGVSVDYTGSVIGPMRLPVFPNDPRPEFSPVYSLQNIQITKKFENDESGIFAGQPLEIYAGVKNLLNFTPPANAIMRPFDPFDKFAADAVANPNGFTFDPTYAYAPFQGIRAFVGVRWHWD